MSYSLFNLDFNLFIKEIHRLSMDLILFICFFQLRFSSINILKKKYSHIV